MKEIDSHTYGSWAHATRPPTLEPARPTTPRSTEGDKVKYMLQVRFNGADAVIHELPADEQEKLTAEFIAIRQSPGVLDGNQLETANSGVTVSVHAGQTEVTEGPAVDAGAALDGYYIYDAPDIDAAIAFAARIPVARMGGSIEVRELVER